MNMYDRVFSISKIRPFTEYSGYLVFANIVKKKAKGIVQGVLQSQTAALLRHREEEETDKTKQSQIEQTYEKH